MLFFLQNIQNTRERISVRRGSRKPVTPMNRLGGQKQVTSELMVQQRGVTGATGPPGARHVNT